jgi:hypothetical protein
MSLDPHDVLKKGHAFAVVVTVVPPCVILAVKSLRWQRKNT